MEDRNTLKNYSNVFFLVEFILMTIFVTLIMYFLLVFTMDHFREGGHIKALVGLHRILPWMGIKLYPTKFHHNNPQSQLGVESYTPEEQGKALDYLSSVVNRHANEQINLLQPEISEDVSYNLNKRLLVTGIRQEVDKERSDNKGKKAKIQQQQDEREEGGSKNKITLVGPRSLPIKGSMEERLGNRMIIENIRIRLTETDSPTSDAQHVNFQSLNSAIYFQKAYVNKHKLPVYIRVDICDPNRKGKEPLSKIEAEVSSLCRPLFIKQSTRFLRYGKIYRVMIFQDVGLSDFNDGGNVLDAPGAPISGNYRREYTSKIYEGMVQVESDFPTLIPVLVTRDLIVLKHQLPNHAQIERRPGLFTNEYINQYPAGMDSKPHVIQPPAHNSFIKLPNPVGHKIIGKIIPIKENGAVVDYSYNNADRDSIEASLYTVLNPCNINERYYFLKPSDPTRGLSSVDISTLGWQLSYGPLGESSVVNISQDGDRDDEPANNKAGPKSRGSDIQIFYLKALLVNYPPPLNAVRIHDSNFADIPVDSDTLEAKILNRTNAVGIVLQDKSQEIPSPPRVPVPPRNETFFRQDLWVVVARNTDNPHSETPVNEIRGALNQIDFHNPNNVTWLRPRFGNLPTPTVGDIKTICLKHVGNDSESGFLSGYTGGVEIYKADLYPEHLDVSPTVPAHLTLKVDAFHWQEDNHEDGGTPDPNPARKNSILSYAKRVCLMDWDTLHSLKKRVKRGIVYVPFFDNETRLRWSVNILYDRVMPMTRTVYSNESDTEIPIFSQESQGLDVRIIPIRVASLSMSLFPDQAGPDHSISMAPVVSRDDMKEFALPDYFQQFGPAFFFGDHPVNPNGSSAFTDSTSTMFPHPILVSSWPSRHRGDIMAIHPYATANNAQLMNGLESPESVCETITDQWFASDTHIAWAVRGRITSESEKWKNISINFIEGAWSGQNVPCLTIKLQPYIRDLKAVVNPSKPQSADILINNSEYMRTNAGFLDDGTGSIPPRLKAVYLSANTLGTRTVLATENVIIKGDSPGLGRATISVPEVHHSEAVIIMDDTNYVYRAKPLNDSSMERKKLIDNYNQDGIFPNNSVVLTDVYIRNINFLWFVKD